VAAGGGGAGGSRPASIADVVVGAGRGGGGAVAGGGATAGVVGAGGTMTPHRNPLGVENASACGIDALLRVLLRIVAGFRRPADVVVDGPADGTTALRGSHERLLFDVLVPLHRPSGMVLWRDQTPLIGLYHETLVRAMGAILSLDGTLAGPVVGALLHPDIWPLTGGGNTPKVVLLLHEADDLIGLLLPRRGSPSAARDADDGDGEGGRDDDDGEERHLASFDPYLVPLASRLCSCISSENSRTSERALQFFRNETFQRLAKRRLDDVGHLFVRALCRCPAMDAPWNPTVRKMTLLVVSWFRPPPTSRGDFVFI
jgi:hypothetical protein